MYCRNEIEHKIYIYYSDKRTVLCCLLKMDKYFDMNEVNKIGVNTLL